MKRSFLKIMKLTLCAQVVKILKTQQISLMWLLNVSKTFFKPHIKQFFELMKCMRFTAKQLEVTPNTENVYGKLPLHFQWDSLQELTVKETSFGSILQSNNTKNATYPFHGNFSIPLDGLQDSNITVFNITLQRKSDSEIVQIWTVHLVCKYDHDMRYEL